MDNASSMILLSKYGAIGFCANPDVTTLHQLDNSRQRSISLCIDEGRIDVLVPDKVRASSWESEQGADILFRTQRCCEVGSGGTSPAGPGLPFANFLVTYLWEDCLNTPKELFGLLQPRKMSRILHD